MCHDHWWCNSNRLTRSNRRFKKYIVSASYAFFLFVRDNNNILYRLTTIRHRTKFERIHIFSVCIHISILRLFKTYSYFITMWKKSILCFGYGKCIKTYKMQISKYICLESSSQSSREITFNYKLSLSESYFS